MAINKKFKSGAASFYIVAFSTLILVIIAASFASAIIAEITRSSNSDLAQSAYDAALAGVEDAKAAFINYQNCMMAGGDSAVPTKPNGDGSVTCGEIVYWMKHAQGEEFDPDATVNGNPINDCDMVGHILGRIRDDASGEVNISETANAEDTNNNMQQAYTCVIIKTQLDDYKADLSAMSPYRIIKIQLEEGNHAKNIGSVRISWYSNKESDATFNYSNFDNGKIAFQSLNKTDPAVPPMIGVQLVQTANSFYVSELYQKNNSNRTDRAAVYLVPTKDKNVAGKNTEDEDKTFIGAYKDNKNIITSAQMASSNDHSKDYPYAVYCPENSADAYACSTTIELPEPLNGDRNDDTFMFVVSLPYGQPDTDFSLELLCKDGTSCGTLDGEGNVVGDEIAKLDKMQVMIDSTGRANDLFRRLEIRLDPGESAFDFPLYAVQVDDTFGKDMTVTREINNYSSYSNW